ncbi:MAG TPA: hypothetical protein VJ546_02200 [Bacillales bacterium]|nr:hypothetical protein [Bacillales bacterium]
MKNKESDARDYLYGITKKAHWVTFKDAATELFEMEATLISDGSSLDVARKHQEKIPDEANLFVICNEETFKKLISN